MDRVTAISLVLSVAREHSTVDVFQELTSVAQDKIEASDVSTPHQPSSLWRIQFGNKSLLLKQGCLQNSGDDASCLEYDSFDEHYKVAPSFTPRPFAWSKEHQIIVLEDLKDYVVLYDELLASHVDMAAIRKFGASIGQLHKASHAASNSIVARDLMNKFRNNPTASGEIQSRFHDTFSPDLAAAISDATLKSELTKLLSNADLMTKVESLRTMAGRRKECLSHALLSTSAVRVKDGDVKLLDGHNATFMAPCGFDVGLLLADYISLYHEHLLTEVDNDSHRNIAYQMVDACQQTVAGYLEEMTAVPGPDREPYISSLMSDAAGYCGMQLIAKAVKQGQTATSAESKSKAVATLQSGKSSSDSHKSYPRCQLSSQHRPHVDTLITFSALIFFAACY